MKIDQSTFVQDLIIKKRLTKYNANVISITACLSIDMSDPENSEEIDLQTYQCLIGKLIYLACGIRPNIAFVVGQLSRHNADLKKDHL